MKIIKILIWAASKITEFARIEKSLLALRPTFTVSGENRFSNYRCARSKDQVSISRGIPRFFTCLGGGLHTSFPREEGFTPDVSEGGTFDV